MKWINPNYVTTIRLVLAPLVCFLLQNQLLEQAFFTMVAGEFTDFLDGFVARRTNQVSSIGKIYDPMCDSIFHMVIWISFLACGWIPVYFVVLFFVRDSIVSTIRICLASHSIVLAARKSGKMKAVFQAGAQLAIVLCHIFLVGDKLEATQLSFIVMAALVTVWSLYDYGWRFYEVVKEKKAVLE